MGALEKVVDVLIAAQPGFESLGNDAVAEGLRLQHHFCEHDVAAVRVLCAGVRITALIVPRRLWHSSAHLARLVKLRAAVRALGHPSLLVPEGFVRRQPRLGNARLLAGAADIAVSGGDRMSILKLLTELPGSSLEECAEAVRLSEDPFGAVLALACAGDIEIDPREPFTPFSVIYRRRRQ
jgi:hypothetical protein